MSSGFKHAGIKIMRPSYASRAYTKLTGKLHFGYLYSRPSLTAEADYAETSTFGQKHRLSVGASLGLFKTDKWYLSEGAVLGQVDYSFYIGEERNEEQDHNQKPSFSCTRIMITLLFIIGFLCLKI